ELKNAVTNISHDLRTPLTAICGYLDMLDHEEQTENSQRYLRIIRGRTEIMKQLTEELFRYSVFTTVSNGTSSEPVILNSMLEDSLSAFYTALKQSRITPSVSLPDQKVQRLLNR
ncbi:sensor histidine kinase, partial [Pseudomonas otitidis]|nr:sensor histidine kinase [Pseudomonas otitidis]